MNQTGAPCQTLDVAVGSARSISARSCLQTDASATDCAASYAAMETVARSDFELCFCCMPTPVCCPPSTAQDFAPRNSTIGHGSARYPPDVGVRRPPRRPAATADQAARYGNGVAEVAWTTETAHWPGRSLTPDAAAVGWSSLA